MDQSKIVTSFVLAVILLVLLAAGGFLVYRLNQPEGGFGVVSEESGEERLGMPAGATTDTGGEELEVEVAATAADTDESQEEAEVRQVEEGPVSIEGVVIDVEEKGIVGAQIVAVNDAEWGAFIQKVQRDFSGVTNPFDAIRSVGERSRERMAKLPKTESGEEGRFAFRALAKGEYRLLTTHSRYLPELETWAAVDGDQPATVKISLVDGYSISGTVVDGTGKALPGASVAALPSSQGEQKGYGKVLRFMTDLVEGKQGLVTNTTTTNDEGHFELSSLEPVSYQLTIRVPRFKVKEVSKVPAGTKGLVVVVDRGSKVFGRVVDPAGQPVAGAAVKLAPPLPKNFNNPLAILQSEVDFFGETAVEVKSREDGTFAIPGLDNRAFDLSVKAEGYPPLAQVVEVKGETDLGDLPLQRPQMIAGVVVSEVGAAIAGAKIKAGPIPATGQPVWNLRPQLEKPLSEAESDREGRFTLEGLSAGEFLLRVESEEYANTEVPKVRSGDVGVKVTLKKGLTLYGVVLDAGSKEPIEGASITVAGGRQRVASDESGAFEIVGLSKSDVVSFPANDQLYVSVSHPDYEQGMKTVSLPSEEGEESLEISLRPLKRLFGVVVDEDGDPIPRARVRTEMPGIGTAMMAFSAGGASGAVFSSADGSFVITRPPLGLQTPFGLEVVASHPHYSTGRVKLAGLADDAEVEVVLEAGTTLTGRITDEAGRGITGAVIRLHRSVGLPPELGMAAQFFPKGKGNTSYSGSDGYYLIDRLEEGLFELEIAALGYARKVVEGFSVQGREMEKDFVLNPGGRVEGRVLDADGNPLGDVEVVLTTAVEGGGGGNAAALMVLRWATPGLAQGKTDGEGRFLLKNLPEGSFSLIARKSGFSTSETLPFQVGGRSDDIVIVLNRLLSLYGRVVDAITRQPVSAFQVQLLPLDEAGNPSWSGGFVGPRDFKDDDGIFVYEDIEPGQFQVGIKSADYSPYSDVVEVRPGEEKEIEVLLAPGLRYEGSITNALTGEPISGVRLTLSPIRRQPGEQRNYLTNFNPEGTTDEMGEFSVRGIGEGEYVLQLSHPDYFLVGSDTANHQLTFPGAETEYANFKMQPAGRLRGTISDLPESLEARVTVRLELIEDGRSDEAKREPTRASAGRGDAPDAVSSGKSTPVRQKRSFNAWVNPMDGSFNADSLPPGRYRVTLRRRLTVADGVSSPDTTLPFGEVEIQAGRVEVFDRSYTSGE